MLSIFTLETPKLIGADLRLFMLQTVISTDNAQVIYSLSLSLACFALLALSTYPLIDAVRTKESNYKLYLSRVYDIAFIASFAAVIMLARWPGLLAPELNPDESTHIAGAIKLIKDPVFWRSVDGTTSGPLNYYILTIPKFIGLEIEYASARLISLLLILISVTCSYCSLSQLYQKVVARIAIIPTVLVFSLMTYFDYVHYNSEYVSISIISIQLLFVFTFIKNNKLFNNELAIFLFGLLCSCVPFSKLQAVPISVSIGAIFVHILLVQKNKGKKSWKSFLKNILILALGCLVLPIVVLSFLVSFSIYNDFSVSYIHYSLSYAEFDRSLLEKIQGFLDWVFTLKDTRSFFVNCLYSSAIILTFMILKTIFKKTRRLVEEADGGDENTNTQKVLFYTLIVLLSSTFSVIQPGRDFGHYVLFLVIPIGLFLGTVFGEMSKLKLSKKRLSDSRKAFLLLSTIFLLVNGVGELPGQIWGKNPFLQESQTFVTDYRSTISNSILDYVSPGDSVAIWGWMSSFYVETGTAMATRDIHSAYQISGGPYQQYYLQRFANDLAHSDALLFVEAVAPKMKFFTNRDVVGFEQFPIVAEVITRDFNLVEEVEGVRIYKRF